MKIDDEHKLRFVVLHHTDWPGRADHYDLMLQKEIGAGNDDRVLITFNSILDSFPSGEGDTLCRSVDHRRAYLDYEGALSGSRGRVKRADTGELRFNGTLDSALGRLFELKGVRLSGSFQLVQAGKDQYLFKKQQ